MSNELVLDRTWKTFHLFAGAGGGILADLLLGHIPIGAVEIEAYPREILLARQADGILPWFPVWDDVQSFRTKNPATREYFAYLRSIRNELAICGGFPCQDISCAGKGAGISGERSGLWGDMFRVVRKIRPAIVFVENSPMLTNRGLDRVLGDLATIGYNAVWCVLGADDCGAPHRRKRIWIMAYPDENRRNKNQRGEKSTRWRQLTGKNTEKLSHPDHQGLAKRQSKPRDNGPQQQATFGIHSIRWWDEDPADIPDTSSEGLQDGTDKKTGKKTEESKRHTKWGLESRLGRVAHGVAYRVDRLKSIGNGQVPAVAATAWIMLEIISSN